MVNLFIYFLADCMQSFFDDVVRTSLGCNAYTDAQNEFCVCDSAPKLKFCCFKLLFVVVLTFALQYGNIVAR